MSKEKKMFNLKNVIIMKTTATITKKNYQRLIDNVNLDYDFFSGSTRFKYENKGGFIWSFRFFKVKDGVYQTKQRLGHMKENYGYCGSLEIIFEYILNS